MSKARELADLINKLDGGARGPVHEQWARTVGAFKLVDDTISATIENLDKANHQLRRHESHLRQARSLEQQRTSLYVARMEAMARMRQDILAELEDIVPFSVFPSGIIDDPDSPALDEQAAADFKATLTDALSWDELSDLVLKQDTLKKAIQEQKEIREEEAKAEQEDATRIQNLIAKIRETKAQINDYEHELSTVREFADIIQKRRNQASKRFHEAAANGTLDENTDPTINLHRQQAELGKLVEERLGGSVKIMKGTAKVGVNASGSAQVVRNAQKSIDENLQKVKDLQKRLAIAEGRNQQLTDELDQRDIEIQRQKENAEKAIILPASSYSELRLNIQQFGKKDKALAGRPIDRWIAELAKRNVLQHPQEALLITSRKHKDTFKDHARRQLALRAGVHLTKRTIMIRPTMQLNPDGNIYKCELLDADGREAYLALGIVDRNTEGASKGEWGKLYVVTCMSAHPSWTEEYERSGLVPNDITSNYFYNIDPDILGAYETLRENLPVEPTDMLGLTMHNPAHSIALN